ncbi:toxin-antitoxin system YwqK family antitoxin [Candidatus Margulisiibacteriota bacterium]
MKKLLISIIAILIMTSFAYAEVVFIASESIESVENDYDEIVIEYTYYVNHKEVAKKTFDDKVKELEVTGHIPDGVAKRYYDSGQVRMECTYKNNKLNGARKTYWPNGNLHIIDNWKNGKQNGSSKEYYVGGNLKKEGTVFNGLQDGVSTVYYQTGELLAEAKYKKGIQNAYKTYYKNGKIRSIVECKDCKVGELNGYMRFYYYSGELKYEGQIKDNMREGIYKMYYKSGKIMRKMTFKKDKLNGMAWQYDDEGVLVKKELYKDGQIVGERKGKKDKQSQMDFIPQFPSIDRNGLVISPQNKYSEVNVDQCYLEKPGFIVIRAIKRDSVAEVLGHSELLNAGLGKNLKIQASLKPEKSYFAFLYQDDGDKVFNVNKDKILPLYSERADAYSDYYVCQFRTR